MYLVTGRKLTLLFNLLLCTVFTVHNSPPLFFTFKRNVGSNIRSIEFLEYLGNELQCFTLFILICVSHYYLLVGTNGPLGEVTRLLKIHLAVYLLSSFFPQMVSFFGHIS